MSRPLRQFNRALATIACIATAALCVPASVSLGEALDCWWYDVVRCCKITGVASVECELGNVRWTCKGLIEENPNVWKWKRWTQGWEEKPMAGTLTFCEFYAPHCSEVEGQCWYDPTVTKRGCGVYDPPGTDCN